MGSPATAGVILRNLIAFSDQGAEVFFGELEFDTADLITVLSERGAPTPVAWTRMRAPQSAMAPSPDSVVQQVIGASALKGRYADMVDRDSAYEKLQARTHAAPTPGQGPAPVPATGRAPAPSVRQPQAEESMVAHVVTSSAFKSMLRSAGTVLGREVTRSLFGTARRQC